MVNSEYLINMQYTSIDLFAGAGGLSEGLKWAGFNCLWANEFDEPAAKTFAENAPSVEIDTRDIREINPAVLRVRLGLGRGQLDLVAGGPPCQGFSTYGKREKSDPRNQLYNNFFEFVKEFSPKTFVMENVSGILSMDDGAVVADILAKATALGYCTSVNLVKAELFGVPQKRRRVFIMGSRLGQKISFIPSTHQENTRISDTKSLGLFDTHTVKPVVSVRAAISDLSGISVFLPKNALASSPYVGVAESEYQERMRRGSSEISNHSAKQMLGIRRLRLALLKPGDYGRNLERIEDSGLSYADIDVIINSSAISAIDGCRQEDIDKENRLRELLHQGHHSMAEIWACIDAGGFANKYRRLSWDEPSHTLVAHMARDCSDFVHPELARFISVREAARLQSFPDIFRFVGSQFQQFKQIGNAVPPLLGQAVGASIAQHLHSPRSITVNSVQPSTLANLEIQLL